MQGGIALDMLSPAGGGLLHDQSEQNMRLLAEKVLPVLKHDPTFSRKPDISRPVGQGPGLFVSA
jgi:hypothetical protein